MKQMRIKIKLERSTILNYLAIIVKAIYMAKMKAIYIDITSQIQGLKIPVIIFNSSNLSILE